jgi:hypothetical protein
MHPFQQGLQSIGKGFVAVGATKPAGLLEVSLRETANRTLLHAPTSLQLLRGAKSKEQVRKGKACGICYPLFLGTRFAEVHLLHLAIHDLGQKNGRLILLADVAGHGLRKVLTNPFF